VSFEDDELYLAFQVHAGKYNFMAITGSKCTSAEFHIISIKPASTNKTHLALGAFYCFLQLLVFYGLKDATY